MRLHWVYTYHGCIIVAIAMQHSCLMGATARLWHGIIVVLLLAEADPTSDTGLLNADPAGGRRGTAVNAALERARASFQVSPAGERAVLLLQSAGPNHVAVADLCQKSLMLLGPRLLPAVPMCTPAILPCCCLQAQLLGCATQLFPSAGCAGCCTGQKGSRRGPDSPAGHAAAPSAGKRSVCCSPRLSSAQGVVCSAVPCCSAHC